MMKNLCTQNEIRFAPEWIVLYMADMNMARQFRGSFDKDSPA